MTGEAIRIRRSARPTAPAIRCASLSPRRGQNHARTGVEPTCTSAGATAPLASTEPVSQSCSKSVVYDAASASEAMRTITFSSRVHESSVQFVEPVHTALPSRTMYLWCIRSGIPGIARVSTGSAASSSGSVAGGGGPCMCPG